MQPTFSSHAWALKTPDGQLRAVVNVSGEGVPEGCTVIFHLTGDYIIVKKPEEGWVEG